MSEQKTSNQSEQEYLLPHVLELKHPVQFGNEAVTQLEFQRRLTAEDIFNMPVQGQTLGDTFKLIGKMCLVTPALVKKLDAEDVIEASRIVNSFLPNGQEID